VRKIIEYTLVSLDGVFGDTQGFFEYRDDAYMRNGLGLLLKQGLLDVLDLSIHPLFAGHGRLFFREGENARLRLIATKMFSKGIVKLTYEPQY
jgi:hypothetical protein